ncbi:hypothetical protein N7456_007648 [Penicillium angulare]|uniref:F-box domain-containing protein n=1 Tax=Penicillium angulare TaxID=116970 RepID=A0A9W9FB26_9EURO|nr:hypothetical protein N7456_007648 [Penicillium angulare]
MAQSSQTRAFVIPEIVTLILQQMDMRTLMTAQRISRGWKDLICNSQSLQEKLFFQPISHDHDQSPRVGNPLLLEAFPSAFHSDEFFTLEDLAWEKQAGVREMFFRPEASWRRMLTHQPPLYRVGTFSSSANPWSYSWSQERAIIPKDGLRMAPLFEFLIDHSEQDWAFDMAIEVLYPVPSPASFHEPDRSISGNSMMGAQQKMMKHFDLVLQFSSSSTCTAEQDYEEWEEERQKKAREDGVELEDTNVDIWKRISEYYSKLGSEMAGFQTQQYDSGWGMWD